MTTELTTATGEAVIVAHEGRLDQNEATVSVSLSTEILFSRFLQVGGQSLCAFKQKLR